MNLQMCHKTIIVVGIPTILSLMQKNSPISIRFELKKFSISIQAHAKPYSEINWLLCSCILLKIQKWKFALSLIHFESFEMTGLVKCGNHKMSFIRGLILRTEKNIAICLCHIRVRQLCTTMTYKVYVLLIFSIRYACVQTLK